MFPRGALYSNYPLSPSMPGPQPNPNNGSLFKKKNRFLGAFNTSSQISSEQPILEDGESGDTEPFPVKSHRKRRDSSIASLTELRSNIRRRSASLRARNPSSPPNDKLAYHTDQRSESVTSLKPTISSSSNTTYAHRQKSSESVNDVKTLRPPSAADNRRLPRRVDSERPSTAASQAYFPAHGDAQSVLNAGGASNGGTSTASLVYQRIQDTSAKRISTLDYLRKAHEGRTYWFNTLLYNKSDLSKLPYFDPQTLPRRATNYLLLGLSIPAVLDPNANTLAEYLRAFNALLLEFESYQTIHPPDGSAGSSLSRVRVPHIFKRTGNSSGNKVRRASAATDVLSPQSTDSASSISPSGLLPTSSTTSLVPFAGSDRELLPGEEYNFLLTPSLPFDPDYFETFATLCDALIDCYTTILNLSSSPEYCGPGTGDQFAKADSKVRKILVAAVVRDFEDSTKQGLRAEIAGVGKVVLGGLM